MLKLVFDLQALQNESRGRGIGRYCLNLFQALARREDVELFALLNGAFADQLEEQIATAANLVGRDNVLVLNTVSPSAEVNEDNRSRRALGERLYEELLSSITFDVLLVGSLFEGFLEDTVTSLENPRRNYRSAVILYDLIPLINQKEFLAWDKARRWYFDRLVHLRNADVLLSISDSARSEAIEHAGFDHERVVAIGTAVDEKLFNLEQSKASPKYLRELGIIKPFVMHASALEQRKNFDGLVEAFAAMPQRLRKRYQLLLVGRSQDGAGDRLLKLATKCGLDENDVVVAGYVSDEELASLYRSCSLFVFPSFHEGFGLPALEAMACGCPTIGSNRSSIPEVIGREDLLFDPSNVQRMAKMMADVLSNRSRQEEMSEHALSFSRQFSWDSVADRAVAALRGLAPPAGAGAVSLERSARAVGDLGLSGLDHSDLQALASALVDNEQEAFRIEAKRGRRTRWRVEGPFDSTYSLALLNRETARALDAIGFDVVLHSTEGPGDFDPNPDYLAAHQDLVRFHAKSKKKAGPADCVTRLLYPPRVADMKGKRRGLHHYAWEETGFPQDWVDEFNSSLNFMTCLSRHVEKLMIDNGVTVPLLTSGCGVDHWERVEPATSFRIDARSFKFLHVSSCFPRKGIEVLLDAYGQSFSAADDVSLIIKTFDNPHNDVDERLSNLRAKSQNFPHVVVLKNDLSEAELKALYELCDVIVGPSCAEGYGLPFAEAMLSGLPVITTNWGGQLDFCNPGNSWLIDYTFEQAKTHFGLWNSAWARPDARSLANAMRTARDMPRNERSAMARRGREQLLATHKWSDAARRLATAAAQLSDHEVQVPHVGWISTWNSRCGIAEYSRHLLEQFDLPVTVFGPDNEETLSDEDDCVRAWSLSKTEGRLHQLLTKDGADCDVFVVQFNYGFYDHADLSSFIREAVRARKAVIIVLHSTVDPTGQDNPEGYNLEYIAPALRLCDRILVHSIPDLNRLKSLGLTDNVALFPHGVVDAGEIRRRQRKSGDLPVIGTYGFALPEKGLEEIVAACAILNAKRESVKLKMVNAEYPAESSESLVAQLQDQITESGLGGLVEAHHDFLPSQRSIELLQECDLVVFAYQRTGESSSAAVRYGLASGVPVAVTPLPIFSDVKGAVYSMDGCTPQEIASSLRGILSHVTARDDQAREVESRARSWRDAHLYSKVSRRLANICTALSNNAKARQRTATPVQGPKAEPVIGAARDTRSSHAHRRTAEALR